MYDVNAFLKERAHGDRAGLEILICHYLEVEFEMDQKSTSWTDPELQSKLRGIVQQLETMFGLSPEDIDLVADTAEAFREYLKIDHKPQNLKETA